MSLLSPEQPLTLVPHGSLPALRLLPVPVSEPPYDDELPSRPASGRLRPIGPLRSLAPLRLVPEPPAEDEEQVRRRTPIGELPAVRPVAQALVQGLLEVLAGVRPLTQLRGRTSSELYARLEQVVHDGPRPTGLRPAGNAVRSLHLQERPEGVAEVCATVHRGVRAAAFALRFEGLDGHWCCTQLAGL
ncbi:MAG: Rv3235 family protein [Mycobacteriales bacterium]